MGYGKVKRRKGEVRGKEVGKGLGCWRRRVFGGWWEWGGE